MGLHMDKAPRPRRSRMLRSRRRRHILRVLAREGKITLGEIQRGDTVWLTSPQLERIRQEGLV